MEAGQRGDPLGNLGGIWGVELPLWERAGGLGSQHWEGGGQGAGLGGLGRGADAAAPLEGCEPAEGCEPRRPGPRQVVGDVGSRTGSSDLPPSLVAVSPEAAGGRKEQRPRVLPLPVPLPRQLCAAHDFSGHPHGEDDWVGLA